MSKPFHFEAAVADYVIYCYTVIVKVTISVNQRGVLTLPARLRKALGISGEDLLIAETTPEGVLLRPAIALPVEMYTADRIAEFEESERELAQWYSGRHE